MRVLQIKPTIDPTKDLVSELTPMAQTTLEDQMNLKYLHFPKVFWKVSIRWVPRNLLILTTSMVTINSIIIKIKWISSMKMKPGLATSISNLEGHSRLLESNWETIPQWFGKRKLMSRFNLMIIIAKYMIDPSMLCLLTRFQIKDKCAKLTFKSTNFQNNERDFWLIKTLYQNRDGCIAVLIKILKERFPF
jgi:hypothetical protein